MAPITTNFLSFVIRSITLTNSNELVSSESLPIDKTSFHRHLFSFFAIVRKYSSTIVTVITSNKIIVVLIFVLCN